MNVLFWLDGLALAVGSAFLALAVVTSLRERAWRAALAALALMLGNGFLWGGLIALGPAPPAVAANVSLLALAAVFLGGSLLRCFPAEKDRDVSRASRTDERDHMFSRDELKSHAELAGRYYRHHPLRRQADARIHAQPGLDAPGRVYHDPLLSPAFAAAFSFLDRIRGAACAPAGGRSAKADPAAIAAAVLRLARFYGAADAGIAALRPLHYYSHRGRRAAGWGEEIEAAAGSAIVVVVAMDWRMIDQAPALPAILESSRQYVEAAKIAMVVAEYLRGLGFRARAHTDGNYEVLCVPLAIDAGLGELGRMGLLIHPVHGPCVRLAVVTTELELPASPGRDFHAASFCRLCRKCAVNCPTQAIAAGAEPYSRGFRHWSIDQEKCYSFWKRIGSDCAVCLRACPYTKPDTLLHRLVRFYVSRNPLNQRLALLLDDLFYGRKKRIPPRNPRRLLAAAGSRPAPRRVHPGREKRP